MCTTCRSERGDCPGCRLGARIDAARPELTGSRRHASPPPPPPPPRVTVTRAVATIRPETRALVALGYPFFPIAVLALLDPSRSPVVRRHALQALGFHLGIAGLSLMLAATSAIPLLGLSAWPLFFLMTPVYVVASIVYGWKAWHGDDVHVPFVSEFLDEKIPV